MLEGQQTSVAPTDEPPLLPAKERFLTEPMIERNALNNGAR